MKKKKKIRIVLFLILIILVVALVLSLKSIYDSLKDINEVKTLMTIEKYNYTLNDNDSPYFKELFEELKEVLESDELDEEKYAKLMSQLFVIDFYSLQYSISKTDVGGLQFIYDEYQDSFKLKARDSIYNHVESNVYGKRKQTLPNIKNVKVKNIEQKEYKGEKEKDDQAYYVDLSITYDKDLDYPSEVSLILIHKDDKLQIVEME